MKFKSILLALFLPLSLFGATNSMDNLRVNTSFRSFGTNTISGQLAINRGAFTVYGLANNSWYDNAGILAIDLNGRSLYDSLVGQSINWQSRVLLDSAATTAVNYGSRTLNNSVGGVHLDWQNRTLHGLNWTATNDFNVARNQTIGGTLAVSNKLSAFNTAQFYGNVNIENGALNVSNTTSHISAKFISGGALMSFNILGGTNVGQFFRETYTGVNIAIDGATGKPKTEFNSYGANAIGYNPDFAQTRIDWFGTSNVTAGSVLNHNMRLTAHNGNLDLYNGSLTVSNNVTVIATNRATVYALHSTGNVGFNGIITNISSAVSGAASTNVMMYHSGILTNVLRNPPSP